VDASAAQNLPVTKTCSQCGAVLPNESRVCQFCDSSFSVGFSAIGDPTDVCPGLRNATGVEGIQEAAWRGELSQRLNAYRTRRRKASPNDDQCSFSFEDSRGNDDLGPSVAIEEPAAPPEDDFSFTIAIGRPSNKQILEDSPMEIDVSSQPEIEGQAASQQVQGGISSQSGLYPVASIDERRLSGMIDLFCLLFAYGGFLGLFGSLGGHFTVNKLSVEVCASTFAAVYLQYFVLFTIFGGTTPGMMLRGLQVMSFTGEPPTPRQMVLRSAGYLLSAGTFFLGFLWAMWDSDELTWHDRLSRTYLSAEQTLPEFEAHNAAHSR